MAGLADLIGAVALLLWPLMALVVAWRLAPILARHLDRGTLTIKIGEMEIGVQEATDGARHEIEDLRDRLIALERAAAAAAPDRARSDALAPIGLATAATSVGAPSVGVESGGAAPLRILWVDDAPQGNAFELAALADRGHRVTQVPGTAEAVRAFAATEFDLVLSDMGRREGAQFNATAGIDLVAALRALPTAVPIWIHTSPRGRARHEAAAWATGADAIFTSSTALIGALDDLATGTAA